MKRWKERTLFQQLTIIGSFICGLLLFYTLFHDLSGSGLVAVLVFLVLFPILIISALWEQIKETKKYLAKNASIESVSESASDEFSKQLKLSFKEKVVIGVGIALCLLIILFYVSHADSIVHLVGIIFCWITLTVAIVTGILKSIRKKRRRRIESAPEVVARTTPNIHEWTKKIVMLFITLFLCICLASWLLVIPLGMVAMAGTPLVSSWARFPLGALDYVAVDSNDNIYCAITFYSRIQVYDSKGDFLRGWFVKSGTRMTGIEIDDRDLLHVFTNSRGENYHLFNSDGKLLNSTKMTPSQEEEMYQISNEYQTQDKAGNTYVVQYPYWLTKVVKITPSGDQTVIVSDPLIVALVKGPFPGFGFAFVIGLVWSLSKSWHKKRRAKGNKIIESVSTN